MNSSLLLKLKNAKKWMPTNTMVVMRLMRAIVKAYRDVDETILDYKDLNAIYLMSVGTWRHGVQVKKKVIEHIHLYQDSKKFLLRILDEIQARAVNGAYTNHKNDQSGVFGMFGTGFYSFQGKTDNKSVREFIKMCIDISEMDEDEKMFARAEQVLNKRFKGMRAASASMILHCLKPYTFPILNSNMGSEDIFAALGLELNRKNDINTYINNCRAIKEYRDNNLPFKNYRSLIWLHGNWERITTRSRISSSNIRPILPIVTMKNVINGEQSSAFRTIGISRRKILPICLKVHLLKHTT